MSGRVWLSTVKIDSNIGDRPGTRDKQFGENWEPAQFKNLGNETEKQMADMRRSSEGYALQREDLPEASAVWN